MNEILAVGLQSMQGDMARLEQVAMNLANTLTPGYKRGITSQAAVGGSFASQLGALENASAEGTPVAPVRLDSVTDSRIGTLKFTGQSLDVALAGKGYFEVMTDSGPAYTRNGSFHLDARGRLVNDKGLAVMGTGGEITLGAGAAVIDANGTIRTSAAGDAVTLARLKVLEFDGAGALTRLGEGLFAPAPGMKQVEESQVRQGYLENSNVNSTHEMTQLIQSMRHFETMQKVVQGYDEMLGAAIRKLGET